EDLVADTAALIEHLGGGPAHLVGTSMGARVVQELALARPELVGRAVMMATVGRPHPLARTLNTGEQALHDKRVQLPPEYAAAIKVQLNLSPATVRDPDKAQEWLDIFEFGASATPSAGVRAQLGMDRSQDRLAAYAGITVPSLVIGFADDRLAPAFLGKEVAEAIPGARYAEIERCGHLGYLERPDEVNRVIIDFLLDRCAVPLSLPAEPSRTTAEITRAGPVAPSATEQLGHRIPAACPIERTSDRGTPALPRLLLRV